MRTAPDCTVLGGNAATAMDTKINLKSHWSGRKQGKALAIDQAWVKAAGARGRAPAPLPDAGKEILKRMRDAAELAAVVAAKAAAAAKEAAAAKTPRQASAPVAALKRPRPLRRPAPGSHPASAAASPCASLHVHDLDLSADVPMPEEEQAQLGGDSQVRVTHTSG